MKTSLKIRCLFIILLFIPVYLPKVFAAKPAEPVIDYYAEEKAKQAVELATNLYEHRLYQAAVTELVKLMAVYPQTSKVPDALFLSGTIHADKSNPEYTPQLAIRSWQKLVDRYPQSPLIPRVLMLIAEQWESLNEWENAILAYDRLQERFPKDLMVDDALFWSARAEYKLKRYAEAKNKWQAMLNTYPDGNDDFIKIKGAFSDDALAMVGDVSLLMQDTTAAKAAWEKIVAQYPESPYWSFALYQLGKSYQETYYQPAVAIAYYQKIIEYNPNPTWQRLAKIKIDQCRKGSSQ
jgi:TolA-binding protein